MRILGGLLTTAAVFCLVFLVGNPLLAFDGGSGGAQDNSSNPNAGKVKEKLSENGVSSDEASKIVATMSEDDLAYFASHPERLQIAGGGLTTEEIVLGLLFLAMGVVMVAAMGHSNGF